MLKHRGDTKAFSFVSLTQHKRLRKANGLSLGTGRNALNHIHSAAPSAPAGVCYVEFICELIQPQIPFRACSVLWWSLGGTSPHRLASLHLLEHHELFRLQEPNVNSPDGVEWFPTSMPAAASGCMLATGKFPQLQGTVMTKRSKLILDALLPNPTE